MVGSAHAELLARAARAVGGTAELRQRLRVSARKLESWMSGESPPPLSVFLLAVDLIEDHRDHELVRQLHIRNICNDALHAALGGGRAARGNVQIVFPAGLTIVGHSGFERPFLDYFATIPHADGQTSACGAALKRAEQVVVRDVATDPIFAGTPAGAVMLAARCRSVQSTPIFDTSKRLVGVLSTHYEAPGDVPASELGSIADIAGVAGALLQPHLGHNASK